jgi:antitoxin ParD1/3/4
MATLNISLPDEMREFVDKQVTAGGYATASEYIRDLVRKAQKQAGREWLMAELQKGIDSGPATLMARGDWEEIRRRGHERLAKRGRR